ncbi:MAG: lysylphosphatidylglycerol synthase domain-containing protein, partial [Myxococcota bacterium]
GIGLPFQGKGHLAFLLSFLLVFFVFFFSGTERGHSILLYFFRKIAFFQKFQVQIKALLSQIRQFSRRPRVFFYLVAGMMGWGLEALALYYLALGAGIPLLWWQAVFIFSISTLAGIVFPGGLGGMEGMLVFLLAPLAIKSQVVLVIFLLRLATLWWATLTGSCFLLFLLKKNI